MEIASTTVLYDLYTSPYCEKVRRVLALKGIEHTIRPMFGRHVELKRLNSQRKVPVLDIDGQRIVDSTHIVNFLEARVPSPALYPSDPAQRALVQLYEDWADESLGFFGMYLSWIMPENRGKFWAQWKEKAEVRLNPGFQYVILGVLKLSSWAHGIGRKPRAQVLQELSSLMDMLDTLLKGREYLVGDGLTMADISVSAQLWVPWKVAGFDFFSGRPHLSAWFARLYPEFRGL